MTNFLYEAEIVEAWEDVSQTGNEMLVLEWEYLIGDASFTVRQYLLNKNPASAALLRRLLRSDSRTYIDARSLIGLRARIAVDDLGDWPSVTEVRVP